MPRVAIQVVLYKSSKYLPALVQSLRAQTFSDWELCCLENSAEAAEAEISGRIIEQSGVPHRFVVSAENVGFARGHDRLFALHEAEYVLLLNADAYLDPGFLAACVAHCEREPRCASVSGLIYRWTSAPSPEPTVTDASIIDTAGLEYHSLSDVVDRYAGSSRLKAGEGIGSPQRIFGASGALGFYRRSSVIAASPERTLFDPDFFMYKEDVDLAIRLKRAGSDAWFIPGAVAYHERGIKVEASTIVGRVRTERTRSARLRELSYRNQFRLYVFHASWKLGLRDLLSSVVHEIVRSVFVLISSPSVFFRAWKKIIRDVPAMIRRRRTLTTSGLSSIRLDV